MNSISRRLCAHSKLNQIPGEWCVRLTSWHRRNFQHGHGYTFTTQAKRIGAQTRSPPVYFYNYYFCTFLFGAASLLSIKAMFSKIKKKKQSGSTTYCRLARFDQSQQRAHKCLFYTLYVYILLINMLCLWWGPFLGWCFFLFCFCFFLDVLGRPVRVSDS